MYTTLVSKYSEVKNVMKAEESHDKNCNFAEKIIYRSKWIRWTEVKRKLICLLLGVRVGA